MQLSTDHVEDRELVFQQLLGYHCLLVDVMDICQMMAKGTCLQYLPALATLDVARVPFTCFDLPPLHLVVRLRR
jgi:hypothetical protein